ncbi:mitogen-activated protein kinase kinase kinase kinase 3-like isoform X1 [Penaeus chinensis]|uniref:mitogen-activated protein kinase kinase kinase kinase 3-like isoform X1 n=1 Tax=Penaeus chinensis TaxID=139456 RepID=UPI001FB67D27|nr:mitogen-activated protein kinase kinase kinase kinase 3-like isoform X1 [Penaeus chinensis]
MAGGGGGAAAAAAALASDISRRNPQDEYELIQRIGSGTYGDVYKAKRLITNEFAAIKVIKLEPGDDFTIIQQEILMMKDCRHPNIVAYFGSYLRRDKLWICMEFCGGGSLQDIYHITGPLQERQIGYMCRETLRGLEYLHRMGKMHRDIKGANILLTENGDVKLADFGVSAQITATISKRKSFIGTPYWMAPEVAAVERKGGYNQLCDIWAVGITAIELAELQPPMFDLHPMRALFLMSKSGFKPPTLKDKAKWTQNFHHFVKLSLTKNPKRRPTADKLLLHPFVAADLPKWLAVELLQKAHNPQHSFPPELEIDEEGAVTNVPQRITSRTPARPKQRTKSELHMESVNFGAPLVTELNAEPPPARYQGAGQPWDPAMEEGEVSLDNHDVASMLMESDPDNDVKTNLTWTQSLPGARRGRVGHRDPTANGPSENGGYLRLDMDSSDRDYANLPPLDLSYHSDLSYYDPPNAMNTSYGSNQQPQRAGRSFELGDGGIQDSFTHDYYLNNHYSQREIDNKHSYLEGSNGYSVPDSDNNDYMTTSFILKEEEVPYHDPTCTVADCQRPSCLIPDYCDDTTIPYRSLAPKDQSDQGTERPTRSRSHSRHHKRHRHRSKSDMGSLNGPQQAPPSFRDAQEGPPASEAMSDTLRREKRPLSGSDVLRMSPRSLLQYIDEELRMRGHSDRLSDLDVDMTYSSQATLPVGMDDTSLTEASQALDKANHNSRYSQSSSPGRERGHARRHSSADAHQEEGEELTDQTATLTLTSATARQRAQSDSQHDRRRDGSKENGQAGSGGEEDGSGTPPVPPRRKDKRRHNTPPRPQSNGLPPTPKVHMGACFSKVFNGCPLHIHCTASWIHPDTRDQHILIGAEEGIYTLNLNELHEAAMEQLLPTRTTWMFVIKDVLMSISGKGPYLYRHELIGLHNRHLHKFSLPMNKIPEKFLPRKYAITTKVPDTKGTLRCCVGRNPYNGYKYLCGATSSSLYLMQWYDPLNKFMLLKQSECYLPHPLRVFEMVITPDLEYPLMCVDVNRSYGSEDILRHNLINLNTGTTWTPEDDDDMDGMATVVPRHNLNVKNVTQIEKDAILVCFENVVRVVNLQGKIKERKKQTSELKFDFNIDSIVCLTDSVLAFHEHGMQGRSFKNGEITQEIIDNSRLFRLLGSDRIITLESRPSSMLEPSSAASGENQGVNLYILAGHESSMY